MLLEFAIEEAKLKKKDLAICWLDLANAFDSPFLMTCSTHQSLPIPPVLHDILSNIYQENTSQFVVSKALFLVKPISGVHQVDNLNSIIFNLDAKPLIRSP
jgi:hypothetical protein